MISSQIIRLKDAQSTRNLGRSFGETLAASSCIFLDGQLGAGKTTFVQGLAQGLGIEDVILSPTFTLINEYHEGRIPLYHLDLYRLEPEDVESLCPELYWEGLEVEPGITVIEWAVRSPQKPESYYQIELRYTMDQQREAEIIKF